MSEQYIKVGRYNVRITYPDKILFQKSGITKGDMIDYYHKIAPMMLPYIKDRLLTMKRFIEGIDKEGFFQKNAPDYFPSWAKRVGIEKQDGGIVNYVVCNNAATLVYLSNYGCITPHVSLDRIDKLDYPDRMIFDFDPSTKNFSQVQKAAQLVKKVLDSLKLPSFVMTTGSRGLHVVIPLRRVHTFDYVRSFAREISQLLEKLNPGLVTTEIRKNKRGSRVFVDYLRNAFGQTSVAPYAVRAKPSAPIATPISWQEALSPKLKPNTYTIKNIFKHLAKTPDPWKELKASASSLSGAQKLFEKKYSE